MELRSNLIIKEEVMVKKYPYPSILECYEFFNIYNN